MKIHPLLAIFLAGCSAQSNIVRAKGDPQSVYLVTSYKHVPATQDELNQDIYTMSYNGTVLTVRYSDSQISEVTDITKITGHQLHRHERSGNADLSQIPPVGSKVLACVMDQNHRDHDGDLIIPIQPTPDPCLARIGNKVIYEPHPNGPILFDYVNFEILSEELTK